MVMNILNSQEKSSKLNLEFGRNFAQYEMRVLNEELIDVAMNAVFSPLKERIESGRTFNFAVSYDFLEYLSLGVIFCYQNGISKHNPTFNFFENGQDVAIEGIYQIQTSASTLGFSKTLFVSEIIRKRQVKYYPIKYGLETNICYGKSSFNQFIYFPTPSFGESIQRYYFDNGFSFQIFGKFEYFRQIFNMKIAAGIKLGYQYYSTRDLRSLAGEPLNLINDKLSLDFSGIQGGVFIKISR
jgi:hypothetical protein